MKAMKTRSRAKPVSKEDYLRTRIFEMTDIQRAAFDRGYGIMGGSLVEGYDLVVWKLATGKFYHATRAELTGAQ